MVVCPRGWDFVSNSPCGVESSNDKRIMSESVSVSNSPCGVERPFRGSKLGETFKFLIHRVELKVRSQNFKKAKTLFSF